MLTLCSPRTREGKTKKTGQPIEAGVADMVNCRTKYVASTHLRLFVPTVDGQGRERFARPHAARRRLQLSARTHRSAVDSVVCPQQRTFRFSCSTHIIHGLPPRGEPSGEGLRHSDSYTRHLPVITTFPCSPAPPAYLAYLAYLALLLSPARHPPLLTRPPC